jgi:hypothetical protein
MAQISFKDKVEAEYAKQGWHFYLSEKNRKIAIRDILGTDLSDLCLGSNILAIDTSWVSGAAI